MLKNTKLGFKLVLVGALLIAIPLAFVAVISVTKATAGLTSIENEQLGRSARLLAGTINGVLMQEMNTAKIAAMDNTVITATMANEAAKASGSQGSAVQGLVSEVTHDMKDIKDAKGLGENFEVIMAVGTDGIIFAASDPSYVGVDVSSRPYIIAALAGTANAGDAVLSKVTNQPVVPIASPIVSGDGKIIGAYILVLKATFVSDLVANEKIGKTGYAYVIDNTGLFVAHPDPANVLKVNVTTLVGMEEITKKMLSGQSGIENYVFKGVAKSAGFAPVQATGWSVALSLPDSEFLDAAHQVRNIILILSAISLLIANLIFFLFSRTITVALGKGVAFAELVAGGDFTQQLRIQQRDEVGRLAEALNGMAIRLRGMVATMQESASQVAASSEEITSSAQQLAEGAQTQASSLEETSASIVELSASVEQVAGHAQSQAAAVEQGSRSMEQVRATIEEVSKSMKEMAGLAGQSVENALQGAKAVQEVVDGIGLIAGSSEKIGGIVTVISDIADQTNLLALNASIEAARAGEHGRGFAVVADEVSKLADRSSSSTKEIEALIKESVKNVTHGVNMARGSQEVMEKIRAASQTVRTMIGGLTDSMAQQVNAVKEMTAALGNVTEMSQSISAATEEQTTTARQVSMAVESVSDVTQSAASAAEQMSAATEQLASLAQELQRMVSQFKITTGDVKAETVSVAKVPALTSSAA